MNDEEWALDIASTVAMMELQYIADYPRPTFLYSDFLFDLLTHETPSTSEQAPVYTPSWQPGEQETLAGWSE